MRRTHTMKRRSLATLVAMTLALVVFTGSISNATVNPRTFTLVATPGSAAVGSNTSFSATIKNTGSYPLGSVDLKVPGPLVITGVGTSLGTWSRSGQTVRLRNLSLAPAGSFVVSVQATVKCSAYPSLSWVASAHQNNNNTGSAFTLKSSGSSRTLLLEGACSLGFVSDRQPADAHPADTITSSPFAEGGDPVQVEILDGHGVRATNVSASIGIAIGNNPSAGTLTGTSPVPTSAGVASFSDLSIGTPGFGYTLVASASALGTATSDPFTIADLAVDCSPNEDCVGSLSDPTTSGTVNAMADASAPTLFMSLFTGGPDCTGYAESSSTLEFDVTSSRTKEVTISFDTGLNPYLVHPDDFQVCFQSDTPFLDADSETVTLGLLPDCVVDYESYGPPVPPCVESRSSDGSIVSVTFLAPAGDPKGRV